ncbi:hypothetical protein C8R44DRAFT_664501, partial [Mycena epipterygia]
MPPRLSSPSASASTSSSSMSCKRPRPRGLWKGRGTPKQGHAFDRDDNPRPSKRLRQRYQHSDDTSDNESDDSDEGYYLLEYSPTPDCSPDADDMDNTEPEPPTKVEDWEDLKELFGRAVDQYECDDVNEALPLLRGVIHECHRFLLLYEDPSELFAEPHRPRSNSPQRSPSSTKPPPKKCKCKESPTAFHAILGTALFLFGNLIAQDATLALPDEPSSAATYWLAALDVFETGENLPSRTSGRGCEAAEDWRMAIVWGRTLLCVADEALTLALDPARPRPAPEPKYPSPAASPFAAIAMRRPPTSRRIVLADAAPHDLLLLAMDQFTRGIFHMPHPSSSTFSAAASSSAFSASASSSATATPSSSTDTAMGAAPTPMPFSRAKELFTIASEVLALAERLPLPAERQRWAAWADSVLSQMDMEGDTLLDAWRLPITRARGRCWLVVGTARVEDIEALAEDGEGEGEGDGWGKVYDLEEAEEAREGLGRAI